MKRLFALLLLLPGLALASNGYPIQFGVPQTVSFKLFASDGTLDVDEADGGSEVTVYCESSTGGTTSGTATNDFADEGSYYNITLTAAETQCAVVVLDIAATDREVVFYPTFGDYRAHDRTQGIASGVAQSATGFTIVLESGTSLSDDYLNNAVIFLTDGTGVGQRRLITDWTSSTDTATVAAWDTTPDSTTEYIVIPHNQASVATMAADVADAVWDESTTGHTTAGTFGEQAKTDIDAILVDTATTLPGTLSRIEKYSRQDAMWGGTVTNVNTTSQFDVDADDDPGGDDIHVGQWICVSDADDPVAVGFCRKLIDYDDTNKRFTFDSAPPFTVEVGDWMWIPVPASNSWVQ